LMIWRLCIETLNAYHTSGSRKGATIDVLREKYIHNGERKERLIIPATQIKGVLRSEATRIWGSKEEITALFGPDKQEGMDVYEEPVLKFTDARAKEVQTVERIHVKIDRATGSHSERGLFSEKAIPAGTVFTGFILSRRPLSDKEKKILNSSLLSASHYGLGKSRSSGLGLVRMSIHPCSREDLIMEMES